MMRWMFNKSCLRKVKKTHNTHFKTDKPVKPVCGLNACYTDGENAARRCLDERKNTSFV